MAAIQSLLKRSLQLKVNTGVDANNKATFKTLSFARVKTGATPQALFNVASSISTLLGNPLSEILVADGSDIIND